MNFIVMIMAALVLAACAKGQGISLAPYTEEAETPQHFRLCHGFGCKQREAISFSQRDWADVLAVFKPAAKNAKAEREQIAKAIGRIERHTDKLSGLNPDRGRAETLEPDESQMDCLDEAINTSRYLGFLADAGVLRFHEVAPPVHRGYFVDGMWPHNSGAVRETETGEIYVVDSYYHDSGEAAFVVPLDTWLDDWKPERES